MRTSILTGHVIKLCTTILYVHLYYNFGLSVVVFPHAATFHCPPESRRVQESPPTLFHTFIFVISLIDTVPFLCLHFTYCLLLMCFGHWCLIYGLSFFFLTFKHPIVKTHKIQ